MSPDVCGSIDGFLFSKDVFWSHVGVLETWLFGEICVVVKDSKCRVRVVLEKAL